MLSNFRMESFTTIPQVTMMPMADIRLSVCPHTHSVSRAKAVSIGISASTMSGCRKLSNWAHMMKYISSTDTSRMMTSSPSISLLSRKLPPKSTSQSACCVTTLRTSFIRRCSPPVR